MDIILVIGRMLFGGFFIYNAYNHFVRVDALAGYAAHQGVPHARLAVLGSGALIFFGGLSVFLGVHTNWGAWAIVAFLIPITYQMHPYWKEHGEGRAMQQIQFNKNVALLGAALMLAALYS
jgi:putative oxidoreductase